MLARGVGKEAVDPRAGRNRSGMIRTPRTHAPDLDRDQGRRADPQISPRFSVSIADGCAKLALTRWGFTLVASVKPGDIPSSRVRESDLAFDGTPPPGNAAPGFVQRPAIPPRQQPVASRGPLKTAAEHRAIVRLRCAGVVAAGG